MPPTTRDVPEAFRTAGAKLSAPLVTVWRRGRVKVNDLLGNPTPETPVGHESTRPPTPKTHTPTPGIHPPTPEIYTPTPEIHTPTPETHTPTPEISMLAPSILPTLPTPTPSPQRTWIPYEVMEMIICCLAYDFYALKQCSLTCRPFYTAATPHLHHTLTLREDTPESGRSWLEPLSKLHELDLVRLVREIRVEQGSGSSSWFVPGAFSDLDSRYFSAFKRVHTLKIQSFQLYRFVPGFEHLFEHFSPTLRSITLYDLCCTPRQLSYFLCLFPNLDDVDIEKTVAPPATTAPVTELIPSSAPKLQGCLVLYEFSWVETWTDLITSRGELGFRHMDLFQSKKCAPVLLGACAETLESIRIHVRDDTVRALDLSQLKVLRSLQFEGWTFGPSLSVNHLTAITNAFSTIGSPVFSEVVIITPGYSVANLPQQVTLFDTLRGMDVIRPFKLVFLLYPRDLPGGARRELVEALDLVTEIGFVNFLDSPPSIRIAEDHYSEWDLLNFD